MSDWMAGLHKNLFTGPLARALGLPNPVVLARMPGGYVDQPFIGLHVQYAAAPGGHALAPILSALEDGGAVPVHRDAAAAVSDTTRIDIFVVDATACATVDAVRLLYTAFHPLMRRLAVNGRVLIAAAAPGSLDDPVAAALARGTEGFMRALAKELGPRGIAVNLVYAGNNAHDRLAGPVRFFCGRQATFVTGQVVHLDNRVPAPATSPIVQALAGKVALVTGAARGIGLAIAQRLAEEGARVVALDVGASRAALEAVSARHSFTPLVLDITADDAASQIVAFLRAECGGVDIVVHNAGVTRDRRLANMMEPYWDLVMDINFGAVVAIDRALLDGAVLKDDGRIVCLSSISGIAGNVGQTNYAMSKAALIGYVAAQAPLLAARGICINAVAPGFIETPMTDAMPFMLREIGRRANALQQGGQPRDVAELVTFLATPGASGISGQTIRVCGQALLGA